MSGRTFLSAIAVPVVTSLPGSPEDGQLINFLADATNGIVWPLRYRAASASAYKWETVGGGAALYSAVDADNAIGAGVTTYSDLANVGPSITLPLAGDYDFLMAAEVYIGAVSSAIAANLSGGGLAVPNDDANCVYFVPGANNQNTSSRCRRRTVTTPGTPVKMQYHCNGVAANIRWRSLHATPVRVG